MQQILYVSPCSRPVELAPNPGQQGASAGEGGNDAEVAVSPDAAQPKGSRRSTLEAQAALAALQALAASLGAFLSPHLGSLLIIALSVRSLATTVHAPLHSGQA